MGRRLQMSSLLSPQITVDKSVGCDHGGGSRLREFLCNINRNTVASDYLIFFLFQWTFQKEGEGIATPVGIFHWGINICSNVHEAWNITSAYWSGMSSKKKRPSKPSCYPGMNAIVDRSYCICGAVADPAKLGVDGLVDGVYRAKLLSCKLKACFNDDFLIKQYVKLRFSL